MKIGGLSIHGNVFLAPMAGVTDSSFREICRGYGASLVYSEMISAKGLYYNDKKTAELMRITPNERPCAIQIFGSDPDIMAAAVEKVMNVKPDIIDINMGCPTPKIVNNGDGSALMKNPRLAGEIVKKVSELSPVPVTVKIRKGYDEDNAEQFARVLEENGAAAIAVHGRLRSEFYRGSADRDVIRRVKNAVSIPVIASGDIVSGESAKDMLDRTGCDALMIGRASEGNPFIFRQINEYLETGAVTYDPSPEERLLQAAAHVRAIIAEKGETRGVRESRKHIAWYIKGLRGAARLKNAVFQAETAEELFALLDDYKAQLK